MFTIQNILHINIHSNIIAYAIQLTLLIYKNVPLSLSWNVSLQTLMHVQLHQ